MEQHGDPEFLTHATAARLYTLIAMRAAGAEVVPLTFVPYAEAIRDHLDALRRTLERKARAAARARASRRWRSTGSPASRSPPRLRSRGRGAGSRDPGPGRSRRRARARLAKVNDALMRVERAFLLPEGLPGRPWFKHAIYAPGLTTGYASWPLPGLCQAIQDNDPRCSKTQTAALATRLDAATAALGAGEGCRVGRRRRPTVTTGASTSGRVARSARRPCMKQKGGTSAWTVQRSNARETPPCPGSWGSPRPSAWSSGR